MRQRHQSIPPWRRLILSAVLLGLGWMFIQIVDEHYAVADWLAWRYLRYWFWCIVIGAGSLGTGEHIVLRLVGRIRGLHAHLFVSFCTGLLVFGLALFGAGMLQLYSSALFYLLPLTMLAIAAPRLWVMQRELLPRLRRLSPLDVRGMWAMAIIIFGMYAWLMIYAGVLTPHNVMFDSRWKHLAIAESFASHGGIFRFDQGWMFASRPHFASYLYTWAFLIPDGELFDRITLCGHIEFVVFAVTTLLGIPAMVRRLVPDADPKVVWVARFLFPGVFLYDSNLSIGADHVAAVFAIPIFIITQDLLRRHFRVRDAIFLGMMTAGILLTKETAAAVTIPSAAVAVLAGAGLQAWRARGKKEPLLVRHRWILAFLAIAVTGLIVSSPMWLKNILWYGDPFYPNFHDYFTPKPWSADSDYLLTWGFYDYQFALWHDDEANQLVETFKVLFSWSFIPHDWSPFHGKRPVIGSLLTLLLPCLLLLKGTRKLWVAALWIHIGIAMWFKVLPQDRYLQVLMPWMAAWTAAVIVLAWRSRVRVAIGALVAAQIIWGGDVYFLHRNMLPRLVSLFSASRKEAKMEKRLDTQKQFGAIGKYMPKGSRLIIHEIHPHLGTGVPTYSDFQTYQFGLSYGLMHSPSEIWQAYQQLGITHLFWVHHKSKSWDTVAGDIMFFDMALRHTKKRKKFSNTWVAELPAKAPEDEADFEDTVAVVGCRKRGYPSGLYRVRDMHVPIFGPEAFDFPAPRLPAASKAEVLTLAKSASYVVIDPSCGRNTARQLPAGFRLATKRRRISKLRNRGYAIHIRLKGEPEPWPDGPIEVDPAVSRRERDAAKRRERQRRGKTDRPIRGEDPRSVPDADAEDPREPDDRARDEDREPDDGARDGGREPDGGARAGDGEPDDGPRAGDGEPDDAARDGDRGPDDAARDGDQEPDDRARNRDGGPEPGERDDDR